MIDASSFLKLLAKTKIIQNIFKDHTNRVYVVGGILRDILCKKPLNFNCLDIDIEVYGLSVCKFDEIMQKINAKPVGKSFFVYKFSDNFIHFDIALARYENKISLGHCGFDVSVCDDEKLGSKRRDFTINALMLNIFSGNFLDFWGGVDDILHKKIKMIDHKTFIQDPLRALRTVRFATTLGFKIDKNTMEASKSLNLMELSRQRINDELYKIFNAKYPELGVFYIYKLEFFKECFGIKLNNQKNIFKALHTIKNIRKNTSFALFSRKKEYECICIYCLSLFFDLNTKTFFDLGLKKHIKNTIKQPKPAKNKLQLLKIALKMPLCEFIGIEKWGVDFALKNNIWKNRLKLNLDLKEYAKNPKQKEKIINQKLISLLKEKNV